MLIRWRTVACWDAAAFAVAAPVSANPSKLRPYWRAIAAAGFNRMPTATGSSTPEACHANPLATRFAGIACMSSPSCGLASRWFIARTIRPRHRSVPHPVQARLPVRRMGLCDLGRATTFMSSMFQTAPAEKL